MFSSNSGDVQTKTSTLKYHLLYVTKESISADITGSNVHFCNPRSGAQRRPDPTAYFTRLRREGIGCPI